MPLAPAPAIPIPSYWTIFGHSYFQLAFGTRTQQGRPDGFFRNLLDVQQGLNIQNHCNPGVRLCVQGDSGFGRVLQVVKGWTGGVGALGQTAPYVVGGQGGSGGAYLLGWGINDLGYNGASVQENTAYQHAMRTVISRCRMSTLGTTGANNYPGGLGTFAMSGFAANAVAMGGGYCTGTGNLFTTTINNTITLTLPADYAGETVALCFLSQPGGTGITWTFSGTAGVTGTLQTSNIQPAGSLSYTPITKRITNLTSANASQTIIMTVTAIDSNFAYFDSWWLEADNAPPVVICNTARLCDNPVGGAGTSGYLVYQINIATTNLNTTNVSSTPATVTYTAVTGLPTAGKGTISSTGGTVTITWTGNTGTSLTGCVATGGSGTYNSATLNYAGPVDADVATFNTYLTSVVAEFDSMVQIADIDSALNKSNQLFCYDGLHPSELGAAKMAQAIYNAVQRLGPTSPAGAAANLQTPAPVVTPISRPYLTGQWYTSDTFGGTSVATTYTAVSGDMFALPFFVTTGTAIWTQWSMQEVAASAAPTVFLGVYDDRQLSGYPQWLNVNPVNGAALSLLAAPGTFTSTTTPATNGYISQSMDPGLYWVVMKIAAIGTGVTFATVHGPSLWVPNLTTGGASPGTGVNPCAWKLTGQGTAAFSGRFPTGAVAVDNAPLIGIKVLVSQ